MNVLVPNSFDVYPPYYQAWGKCESLISCKLHAATAAKNSY